jgi:hypothetical protein
MTYARCRIDTTDSPDDDHMAARNMYSIEINIYGKELCVQLVIYKNYIEMRGQKNIKSSEQTRTSAAQSMGNTVYPAPVSVI